jgi:hypothetical protein
VCAAHDQAQTDDELEGDGGVRRRIALRRVDDERG